MTAAATAGTVYQNQAGHRAGFARLPRLHDPRSQGVTALNSDLGRCLSNLVTWRLAAGSAGRGLAGSQCQPGAIPARAVKSLQGEPRSWHRRPAAPGVHARADSTRTGHDQAHSGRDQADGERGGPNPQQDEEPARLFRVPPVTERKNPAGIKIAAYSTPALSC